MTAHGKTGFPFGKKITICLWSVNKFKSLWAWCWYRPWHILLYVAYLSISGPLWNKATHFTSYCIHWKLYVCDSHSFGPQWNLCSMCHPSLWWVPRWNTHGTRHWEDTVFLSFISQPRNLSKIHISHVLSSCFASTQRKSNG
jgi:hypothetical protein